MIILMAARQNSQPPFSILNFEFYFFIIFLPSYLSPNLNAIEISFECHGGGNNLGMLIISMIII